MARIKQYCGENHDKLIIATGDASQLQPINELSNQFKFAEYADNCINQIFKYEMYLIENKILKSDDDQKKLKQIKSDTCIKDIPLINTIKTIFQIYY